MEELIVCLQQLSSSFFCGTRVGEEFFAQLLNRDAGNFGKPFCHGNVFFGTGWRFEHNRV